MNPKCIDISHYQGNIDLEAFSEMGGLAIVCKATEGVSIRDEWYGAFRDDATRYGLAAASYHFLRPGDMRRQAEFYLSTAEPEDGERVVADYEDDRLTIDDLIEFLKEIQSINPTLQLTVYSGHLAKQQLGSLRNEWLADNTSLWVAQYTGASEPDWPVGTWPAWSLWQYADTEYVGDYGPVDGNRFNGSDEQMLKWFGPVAAEEVVDDVLSDMQFEVIVPPITVTVTVRRKT